MYLFMKSLRSHPGIPVAIVITSAYFIAAIKNGSDGALVLAILLSLVFPWSVVLVTAWGMRKQYSGDSDE